uniref:Cytochrome b n=1 Tax=Brasilocerus sp. 2 DTA-2012 TaxID=1176494 RepID=A0A0H3UL15_9COLE|nr:cytochrome b [Brasilocerus sp. 2 DTA-2012]
MMKMLKSLINLPTPSNISYWWNFGSLLGMCLAMQIITGIMLSMFYCPNISMAFESTINICRNVNYGWIMRTAHSNGASIMFMFTYMHISRGLYYSSFKMTKTWLMGVAILLMTMMIAFMGYILPWGQMSFWGATVITNLISTIPYLGNTILQWIWGGFNINNATLNRMFSLHFLLPFVLMMMSMIHIFFIHEKGSNNPLGTNSNMDKMPFHLYFTYKDLVSMMITLTMMTLILMIDPYYFSDPENFIPANPLETPPHIKPEWYFLFAYSILRSIPNKLGGVVAMVSSIAILTVLPLMKKVNLSSQFCPLTKMNMWYLLLIMMMLTWLSTMPMEDPFITLNQVMTTLYFMSFPLLFLSNWMWKMILIK